MIARTIYWAMDFVPIDRFLQPWKNRIYDSVNMYAYKFSDEMWDLSPRMAAAREELKGMVRGYYRFHRVVPYGVYLSRIKAVRYRECEQNTLVFMGHLLEKQGVQLAIRAMPAILASLPDFIFKIIGDGVIVRILSVLLGN